MNDNNFKTLNLEKPLLSNLNSLGYESMTPIQQSSVPFILKGTDIIGKAKTGSGKTVSFGLGVVNNLDVSRFTIQSLILCPTRELASQVAKTLRDLARYKHNIKILTLTGGVPYKPQVHSLSHQAHILVGTPGRILKHLSEDNFDPAQINTLVLDEADRMLDMGFYDDIKEIIDYIPKNRQTMLFSATYQDNIKKLSNTIMNDPQFIEVESTHEQTSIEQTFYDISNCDKSSLIPKLFEKQFKSVMIFCNTKIQCDELADYLEEQYNIEPLVLHSDLEQKYRDETLILFENKSYPILIATDVASRGLDIKDVDMVINYDMPENFEVYTHRIGRTARAGKKGKTINFCNDKEYMDQLNEFLDQDFKLLNCNTLKDKDLVKLDYDYSTLYISGGKKLKLRAGDILGALTAGIGLDKNDVGNINILDRCSYVAVKNNVYDKAFKGLNSQKIKNKDFRVYKR
ncbi:MAG: ATP-dependent RNA helicase DbpA [Campylobacterota bacterium]|nr:ATP-dependent RNA helicase DbpA [Campylobacterota bacterium]